MFRLKSPSEWPECQRTGIESDFPCACRLDPRLPCGPTEWKRLTPYIQELRPVAEVAEDGRPSH
jgi:hypothetical protein